MLVYRRVPRQTDRVFVSFLAMSLLIGAVWYKAGNQSIFSHAFFERPAFRIYVMSDGGLDFSALCAKVCQHDHFQKSQKPMRRSSPLYTVVMFFFRRVDTTRNSGLQQIRQVTLTSLATRLAARRAALSCCAHQRTWTEFLQSRHRIKDLDEYLQYDAI